MAGNLKSIKSDISDDGEHVKAVLRLVMFFGVGTAVVAVCFLFYGPKAGLVPPVDSYDETASPYDISQNPYKYKGKHVVLDTIHMTYQTFTGNRMPVPSMAPNIQFQKMLDEHTALYEIKEGYQGNTRFGDLAVLVSNNDPPDPSQMWRIYVSGTTELVNAFGGQITVPEVKFVAYEPAAPPPAPLPPRDPVIVTSAPTVEEAPNPTASPESGSDPPRSAAPIERRPPENEPPQID